MSTPEDFKKAIEEIEAKEIKAIYVEKAMTIDYTTEEEGSLVINNKTLSIIGPPSSKGKVNLKAKKIEIGNQADDIFRKFTLWQSGLENIGTNKVQYAIKYNNEKSVIDIRYMGIDSAGFSSNNIEKAYIYAANKLAAGSDLYFNKFQMGTNDKMSAIIIHGFAEDATVNEDEDGEPDIRFEGNTVSTHYGIKFEKDISGQNGDIKLGSAIIGIEWDNDHTNFEGIGLYANPKNVTIKYINGTEEESKPENVTGPKFKVQAVVGDSSMSEISI